MNKFREKNLALVNMDNKIIEEKKRKIKVIHCPTNISNLAWEQSQALKNLGVKSLVLTKTKHRFDFDDDICLHCEQINNIWYRRFILLKTFLWAISEFNIFHFYFGQTLLPHFLDLPILKLLNKKMVMHYLGSEIRISAITKKKNKYWRLLVDPKEDAKKQKRMEHVARYIKLAIIGNYELYDYLKPFFRRIEVIPQAIDIKKFYPVFPSPLNKKPLIVHAPTKQNQKGTPYILKAIKKLEKHYHFQFKLISNIKHNQAQKIYRNADIIIDQILYGDHGVFAVETMALGKPVICYIREDLIKYRPGLPIVSANPDNIYEKLKLLLDNPSLRRELGEKGRKYVEKYHDSKKIALKIIDIFENI